MLDLKKKSPEFKRWLSSFDGYKREGDYFVVWNSQEKYYIMARRAMMHNVNFDDMAKSDTLRYFVLHKWNFPYVWTKGGVRFRLMFGLDLYIDVYVRDKLFANIRVDGQDLRKVYECLTNLYENPASIIPTLNTKCPSCGSYNGLKQNVKYCQLCGIILKEAWDALLEG